MEGLEVNKFLILFFTLWLGLIVVFKTNEMVYSVTKFIDDASCCE